MATERIAKYLDDSKDLLQIANQSKIVSEVRKLASYLLKHQNETVPDGAKTKLASTMEAYYRYCSLPSVSESTRGEVSNLLGTYLQLPEGKLVSASVKRKVLNWFQELNCSSDNSAQKDGIRTAHYSSWIVICMADSGELTLLNESSSELWKEEFKADNIASYVEVLRKLTDESDNVVVKINESNNTIVEVLSL